MNSEAALAWADALIFNHTGVHLTELQLTILQQVWQGKRYTEIAEYYGCTEGHAKDTGADLWKLLSEALGEKVSKRNFQTVAHRLCPDTSTVLAVPNSNMVEESLQFIGRSQSIAHLKALEKSGIRAILIQGEGGIGKTTLAQQYLQTQTFDLVLEFLIAKDTDNLTPIENVVEEWLRRDLNEEAGREFGVTLSRLKRHLKSQRIGILIDNLEPALDQSGRLIASHRNYGELLRVLSDPHNRSLTLITSRDRLCESGIHLEYYRLPGLTKEAWLQYWERIQIQVTPPTLTQIHHTYGGNAKAMQILGAMIREDFNGDAQLYWQECSHDPLQVMALKNLVSSQINRLRQLDPDAYRLLCRLGCYRFQEHPTLPKSALLELLWDVPPERHAQVIQSIRNRSLVEFHCGEYWLHPVIRGEAIARLKTMPEWTIVTQKAATYWTHSVSMIANLNDALKAWEAFYHYVDIEAFDAASQVILRPYQNQWQQYLPLGSLLYRMGLSQLVLKAIHQILDHLKVQSNISELNNILGDLYWITGQLSPAIACQNLALTRATHCLDSLPSPSSQDHRSSIEHQRYYFRMLKIDSLFSLGLYYIDLWNLPQAASLLKQVIELGQQTKHKRWAEKATICLALVQSYEKQTEALSLVQPIYEKVIAAQSPAYTGPFAYFIQHLGQIYDNFGQRRTACQLYKMAITFARDSQYTQVIAVSTIGLAKLNRLEGDSDQALIHHQTAVTLLNEINATCDLAEAHFQWGITLQQLHQPANQHFETAIALFEKIGAPLQIQRVQAREQTCQQSQ